MRKHVSYYQETDDISFVPLTLAEEKKLFTDFYGPDEAAADAAREKIILQHLKLVAKLSLNYAKRALPDDDAISAGNYGLIQALNCKKFRSERGVRFASYIRSFVRGKVIEALKFHQSDRSKLMPTIEGRLSDDATITGCESTSEEMRPLVRYAHSPNFGSVFHEVHPTVQHESEGRDLSDNRLAIIEEGLSRCNETEQAVIRLVFMGGHTLSEAQRELSKTKKISRQGSQQAYARGMEKLKRFLSCRREQLSA